MSPLPLVVSSTGCKCHLMKSSRHESSFFTYSSPSYPVSPPLFLCLPLSLITSELFRVILSSAFCFDMHLSLGDTVTQSHILAYLHWVTGHWPVSLDRKVMRRKRTVTWARERERERTLVRQRDLSLSCSIGCPFGVLVASEALGHWGRLSILTF